MSQNFKVDVLTLGTNVLQNWKLGKSIAASYSNSSISSSVQELLSQQDGYILFLHEKYTVEDAFLIDLFENDPAISVWYDDRISTGFKIPRILQFISPGIYFNLQTSEAGFSLWNMSLKCLLVKKEILLKIGFLDQRFISPDGALMEWCNRILFRGVLIQRENLVVNPDPIPDMLIPEEDELRFIKYRSGSKWLIWSIVRYMLHGLISPWKAAKIFFKVRSESPKMNPITIDHSEWRKTSGKGNFNISVIIPTVERYSYLVTALNQLKEQTILPSEVIIIDQTPEAFRKPELFKGYENIGLKYFVMEKSGQCGSRNLGLQQCSGDYILFIDDDVELKPAVLEEHIKCLKYFKADVSCGVCDEIDAGPIPKDYTFIRHSDVFPTNNGMVRREVLEKSGLFDMAFDHGQRADGDLGARIYKSGARMILNPEIRVLHHRAPRGGLRKHKVRKMTYSSSRKYITHFRLPHITELYLNKIHFSEREQHEYIILTLLGMFSIRGSLWRKGLKVLYASISFPSILYKIYYRNKIASALLKEFPKIPMLKKLDLSTANSRT